MDTAGEDCRQALLSKVSDFEDAVMIETAKHFDADCIVTRNTKDFKSSKIRALSAMEFFNII